MKLRFSFEMMEMDDQIVAVPVGDNASDLHGIIKLNKSAAAVLDLMKSETTVDEIVEKLSARYDSDKTELKQFVSEYVEQLTREGIVE